MVPATLAALALGIPAHAATWHACAVAPQPGPPSFKVRVSRVSCAEVGITRRAMHFPYVEGGLVSQVTERLARDERDPGHFHVVTFRGVPDLPHVRWNCSTSENHLVPIGGNFVQNQTWITCTHAHRSAEVRALYRPFHK